MTITGWVIYNRTDIDRNSSFADWILDESIKLGIDMKLIIKEDINYGIRKNKLFIKDYLGDLQIPDFIIMRNRDDLFTSHLEHMGCKVYNNFEVSFIANHKARAHIHLSSIDGIKMMDTLFIRSDEFNINNIDWEYPLILKSINGHGGKEVFKVNNEDELIFQMREMNHDEVIIQKMCDNPGKDVRVFVIGNEIIGSVLRSSETDFKSNYTLGGNVTSYELSNKEKKLVSDIINSFNNFDGFIGIDFILDKDGNLIFNEIEDVVGSRTLSVTSNGSLNVVKMYLEHIIKKNG